MSKLKNISKKCLAVFQTAEKVNAYTKTQKQTADMLLSMVQVGQITEAQACFTLGVMCAGGDNSIRTYVEKIRQNIKKEEVNE